MKEDEAASAPPGLVLGRRHERAREPAPTQRLVDPHRLELAVPGPNDPGDAGEDPVLAVADEDAELLLAVGAGGLDGSRRDAFLEERDVGGRRRVLDDETVPVVDDAYLPSPRRASAP